MDKATNVEKKDKVSMENLSKEELLKLVKKQLGFLQKLKNKSDELSKKCISLEEEKASNCVYSEKLIKSNAELTATLLELKSQKDSWNQHSESLLTVKQELENIQLENDKYRKSLTENEQQIECLQLKLDSLNAANHCLQKDSEKNDQLLGELKAEVKVLSEARDAALKALKEQKVHSELQNHNFAQLQASHDDLKNVYSKCLEKNTILEKNVIDIEEQISNLRVSYEKLNEECKVLRANEQELLCEKTKLQSETADVSILIRDLSKLQTCVNDLREENDLLIAENKRFKNKSKYVDPSEIEKYKSISDKIAELEAQKAEFQKGFCEEEGRNSNSALLLEQLESQKTALSKELQNSLVLNESIKFELNECQDELEEVKYSYEKLREEFDRKNSELSTGLDEALLHGGYADNAFLLPQEIKKDSCIDDQNYIVTLEENLSTLEDTNKNLFKKNLYLETEVSSLHKQINTMSEKINEYKAQLNSLTTDDTLNLNLAVEEKTKYLLTENELLQKQVSEIENKFIDFKVHSEEEKAEMLTSKLESATDGENQLKNSDQTEILNEKIMQLVEKVETLEFQKSCIEEKVSKLEEEYETKCAEAKDINLKLESVIISIKQGVRQKSISSSLIANREWQENIGILKVLFDEMNMRNNGNSVKIQNLETELENILIQKQTLEDDLLQVKELNQFLEDETRELREEVDQLKNDIKTELNQSENYFDHGSSDSRASELYSIEEDSELEVKLSPSPGTDLKNFDLINSISNASSALDSKVNDDSVSAMSTQSFTESIDPQSEKCFDVRDREVQADFSFEFENKSMFALHESLKDEYDILSSENAKFKIDFKLLSEEHDNLLTNFDAKSRLVERIHCEMDDLLTKVEEFSNEVKEKDSEIERIKQLNNDLKKYQKNDIEVVMSLTNLLNEIRNDKINIETDINSMKTFSIEVFNDLKNCVTDISSQNNNLYESVENSKEKLSHLSEVVKVTNSFLTFISTDLEEALVLVEKTANFEDRGVETPSKKQNTHECQNQISHITCPDTCCKILHSVESLKRIKDNLIHIIERVTNDWNNHIKKYEEKNDENQRILIELNNYKTSIVPEMEETIQKINLKLKEFSKNVPSDENFSKELDNVDAKKSQLSEVELKMNKFKQIALKLKKELAETKKSLNETLQEKEHLEKQSLVMKQDLDKLSPAHCQIIQNYQSLQNEYDKIQDENESQKEFVQQLENNLASILQDFNSNKIQIAELESQLKASKQLADSYLKEKQDMDNKNTELGSKVIISEEKCFEKIEKMRELEELVEKSQKEVKVLIEENKNYKKQLDQALKEGNKKNLMDLEMADYERSITELNNQLLKKNNEITELQNDIKSKNEIINSLTEEIKFSENLQKTQEKRASDLKDVLEKITAELTTTKEQKNELTRNISALQGQLEMVVQQEEQYKLELSEMSAQVQQLKTTIETSNENHQRIVRLLETKIANQKEEILATYKEVENINQEFESYKVRVHSVLKQQKVSSAPLSVETDFKEQENVIDKLRVQLKTMSEKLTASNLEYEALREKYDMLVKRLNKANEELERRDRDLQSKLELFHTEKYKLRVTQEELTSRYILQNEMLASTYKKQIKVMSEEHKKTLSEFQEKLNTADMEILQLQRDQQKSSTATPTPTNLDNTLPFDILTQERQEGEGSENTDGSNYSFRNMSLSTIPTSGFLPFEKLLESQIEPGTPASYMSDQESEKIVTELNLARKKNDHLSDLLNDSESSNLRLSEQVRVLKDEVRRLERNQEREEHAENLEYLKNVVLKFASLQPCSEKAMLIPVLSTMLKLSPEEQQKLKSVAGEIDPSDVTAGSGWGSYIHRWSGLI